MWVNSNTSEQESQITASVPKLQGYICTVAALAGDYVLFFTSIYLPQPKKKKNCSNLHEKAGRQRINSKEKLQISKQNAGLKLKVLNVNIFQNGQKGITMHTNIYTKQHFHTSHFLLEVNCHSTILYQRKKTVQRGGG